MNLLNRVKVVTATANNTATPIALGGADAGFQTFANGGAINGVEYTYVIEEGINWEIQTGVYNSTGPTINRGTPIASSNGGARIMLSGAAKISVQPNMRNFPPIIGKMPTNIGYIHPFGPGDGNGTNLLVANSMYGLPFLLKQSCLIDRLSFRVHNTAVAASNGKIGIFACPNNSSYPSGQPVLESGNLSTATATTIREATGLNTRLPAGFYVGVAWVSDAVQLNRADSTGRSYSLGDIPAFSSPTFATFGSQTWRRSTAYGAWPTLTGVEADWTTRSEDNSNCPAIALGIL